MKTVIILLALSTIWAALYADGALAQQCSSSLGGHCAQLAAIIPGTQIFGGGIDANTISPGDLLERLYVFGVSMAALLAFIWLTAGGVIYLTAGDNESRVGKAKTMMGNALFGLALALLSWLILYTINPDLTSGISRTLTKITFIKGQGAGAGLDPLNETLGRCLINRIPQDCQNAQQACPTPTSDPANPCFCVQNPTSGFCVTNGF